MSELRDHSKPCEHGHKLMHNAEFVGNTIAIVPPCPGGRVVTIDFEAGADYAQEYGVNPRDPEQLVGLFDAALGIDDE